MAPDCQDEAENRGSGDKRLRLSDLQIELCGNDELSLLYGVFSGNCRTISGWLKSGPWLFGFRVMNNCLLGWQQNRMCKIKWSYLYSGLFCLGHRYHDALRHPLHIFHHLSVGSPFPSHRSFHLPFPTLSFHQSSQVGSLTGQLNTSRKPLELATVPRMRMCAGE